MTPTNPTTFARWVREQIAEIEPMIGSDERRTHTYVAGVIREAKALAYQLGLYEIADRLPERREKTALDGLLRLQSCLGTEQGEPSLLLTIREAAALLGVSTKTIRRRMANRDFPAKVPNIGRAVRFNRRDIEAFAYGVIL